MSTRISTRAQSADLLPIQQPAWSKWLDAISDFIFGCQPQQIPQLVPGVVLSAIIVIASIWLADYVNNSLGFKSLLSYIMMAIVLGLVFGNVVPVPTIFKPGLAFCLKKLLRVGIILMGLRLSVVDAAKVGIWGVPIVLICIGTGLVLTTYFTRWLKLPDRLGTLITLGTSICGTTAIVAAAPAIDAEDEEVAYAVANITVFGIFAMLVYPYLANLLFGGNPIMAGLFQGTSIHETAQVTGAGMIYDQVFHVTSKPGATDIAIIMKLVRNLLMVAVIPAMAFLYTRRVSDKTGEAGKKINLAKIFPYFVLGFVAMAVLRSIGDAGMLSGSLAFGVISKTAWTDLLSSASTWSGYALAMAMASVGLGTNIKTLKGLGLKPFYVGMFSALVVGLASALAVWLFGGNVVL